MTRVDTMAGRGIMRGFGWIINPTVRVYNDIKALFNVVNDDFDDFDDDQLARLGLDMRRVNDRDECWEYNGTQRRRW